MTTERFNFQRVCAAQTTGRVLNVGANEDPANLKAIDPDRIINCDLEATDSYLNRPNRVDVLFDVREEWPFEDDFAELVIFGDILEHLFPEEALFAMKEAHRVATSVCITVPSDSRFEETGVEEKNGYRSHCYAWDEKTLTMLIEEAGFEIVTWQNVDYHFVPLGFFVLAERKEHYDEVEDTYMHRGIMRNDYYPGEEHDLARFDDESGYVHGHRLLSPREDS